MYSAVLLGVESWGLPSPFFPLPIVLHREEGAGSLVTLCSSHTSQATVYQLPPTSA